MFIGKFQAYPIYKIEFKWTQLNPEKTQRINEVTSFKRMFKQELSEDEISKELIIYKESQLNKYPNSDVEFNYESIKFFEYETWVCEWFSHSSLNYHLSNEDILKSFSEYVNRYENL